MSSSSAHPTVAHQSPGTAHGTTVTAPSTPAVELLRDAAANDPALFRFLGTPPTARSTT